MRIWTVYPRHLDTRGMVALWREALLLRRFFWGKPAGTGTTPCHSGFVSWRTCPGPSPIISRLSPRGRAKGGPGSTGRKSRPERSRFRSTRPPGKSPANGNPFFRSSREGVPTSSNRPVPCRVLSPHPLFRIVEGLVRDWEKIPRIRKKDPAPDTPRSKETAMTSGSKVKGKKRPIRPTGPGGRRPAIPPGAPMKSRLSRREKEKEKAYRKEREGPPAEDPGHGR
jgi:hypothetical protein